MEGRLKRIFIGLLLTFLGMSIKAQNPPKPTIPMEELIERLFAVQDEDLDYESIYEVLFQLYQNPIDINEADAEVLQATYLLSPHQVSELLNYRNQHGKLISLYELQAIPGFDLQTINQILPFVQLNQASKNQQSFWKRVSQEEQAYVLFRSRRIWETRRGFTAPDTSSTGALSTRYLGDPNDLYLRWRIQHPRDFSMGMTLDKDAGEQFIWDRPTARYGFNFVSFHLIRYHVGKWKTISLGDYQASFGQGLVFGAGYALGKGAETVPTIRKSSFGILPYTAALEFGFFRGLGATYSYKDWEFSLLSSYAPRDGRIAESLDSLSQEDLTVSSLNQSGLHRTVSELSTKNQLRELSLGANVQYRHPSNRLTVGVNYLLTEFDHEWIRNPTIYNQYEFQGKNNQIASMYVNYNWKNFFLFGEKARSISGGMGTVIGFVSSLHKQVDLSFLWRKYDKDFHTFYGNSFAESTRPINEQGSYLGLEIRPTTPWKLNFFYDFFRFPWLKYRVYAPSKGYEWLARVTYRPNRTIQAYLQVREEQKDRNNPNSGEPSLAYQTSAFTRFNGTLNLDYQVNRNLSIRSRIQWSQIHHLNEKNPGFLILQDVKYGGENWKLTARYTLFDTQDYDSRIYAFENHVLWTFSVPAFFGQGQRYYLTGEYDLSRKITVYGRIARTSYTDREQISSGLQTIEENTQTESTFMIRYFINR